MIEHEIGLLTAEVKKLREAIEQQNDLLRCNRPVMPTALTSAQAQPAPPMFLDERSIARMAGFSVSGVRQWRRMGEGPPFKKVGRAVRYSRADFVRWMDSIGNATASHALPR